jgi:hypothetical protein
MAYIKDLKLVQLAFIDLTSVELMRVYGPEAKKQISNI